MIILFQAFSNFHCLTEFWLLTTAEYTVYHLRTQLKIFFGPSALVFSKPFSRSVILFLLSVRFSIFWMIFVWLLSVSKYWSWTNTAWSGKNHLRLQVILHSMNLVVHLLISIIEPSSSNFKDKPLHVYKLFLCNLLVFLLVSLLMFVCPYILVLIVDCSASNEQIFFFLSPLFILFFFTCYIFFCVLNLC